MNGNFPKFQNHLSSIIHPSVFSQRATDQLNDKPSCTTNSVVVGVVFDQPGVTIVHHILIQILDKSRSYRSQNMCVDLLKTLPLSQFQLGAARRGRAISSRNRFRFVMKTTQQQRHMCAAPLLESSQAANAAARCQKLLSSIGTNCQLTYLGTIPTLTVEFPSCSSVVGRQSSDQQKKIVIQCHHHFTNCTIQNNKKSFVYISKLSKKTGWNSGFEH